MSFDAHLAKRKTRKGSIYLIIGSVFLIPFLILWLAVYLASLDLVEYFDFSGNTTIPLIIGYVFPFIGIPLCLKGIIMLAKKYCLTDREYIEKRIQQLKEDKSKPQNDSSQNKNQQDSEEL